MHGRNQRQLATLVEMETLDAVGVKASPERPWETMAHLHGEENEDAEAIM